MRDGYVARWQGREYQASPDGDSIRLYQREHGDPPVRLQDLAYVRTTCTWQGQPFIVLGEHDAWLRVEYTGGRWPVAEAMRLEVFDFGVYQGWAPAAEVSDLREQRV